MNIRLSLLGAAFATTIAACGAVESQTPSKAIAQHELTTVLASEKTQPKEMKLVRESEVDGGWSYEYQVTYESETRTYTVLVHRDGRVEIARNNN
ncbi:MAG TPA: hypothetical protein VGN07_03405 [Steroidobacteraceae bacterium]|jgi:hypothetical protein